MSSVLELCFWIVTITLGLANIVVNLIAFIVFVTDKTLKTRHMNAFLASLAVADLLMVPLIAPGYALFNCIDDDQPLSCRVFIGMKDFILIASCLHMLAILYERHTAVFKPLSYPTIITSSTVKRLLSLIWITPVICTLVRCSWYLQSTLSVSRVHSIDKIYDNLLLAVFVLCPICIMTIVNVRIIFAIRRQINSAASSLNLNSYALKEETIKKIESQELSGNKREVISQEDKQLCPSELSLQESDNNKKGIEYVELSREVKSQLSQERKSKQFEDGLEAYSNKNANLVSSQVLHQTKKGTIACIRVVLVYIIAWLPRIAYNMLNLFEKQENPVWMKVSLLFLFFQSLLDPFIYSYYRSDFRSAVKRLLYKTRCDKLNKKI